MNYRYSRHAKEQLTRRDIDVAIIDNVIAEPDKVLQQEECIKVFQKIVWAGKKKYLYRAFINYCKEPPMVITVYRTSKIDKYEN